MKNLTYISIVAVLSALSLRADPTDLKIGDSIARVEEVMGKPKGYMAMDKLTIYTYDLGTVRFTEDKVTAIDLITAEELRLKQQQEAEARAARKIQGEAIKSQMEADEKFAALPAKSRLEFWERFRRDYPDVEVYVLYHQAKTEADQIAAKEQEAQRIDELEQRVRQAEAAARQAQQSAEIARVFNQTRYYNRYPYVVNTSPIIIRKTYPQTKPSYPIYGPGWNLNFNLNGGQSQTSTSTSTSFSGYQRGGLIQSQQIEGSW